MTTIERDPQNYRGRSLMWTGEGNAVAPRRSLSAEAVAVLRAAHQLLDNPVIHSDTLSSRIIGAAGRRWLESNPDTQNIAWVRATRAMLATRTRLSEEELLRDVARGCRQYVLLGAGLDTSAYRLREPLEDVTVFEVDEPATQAWKQERLRDAGIGIPPNLRFVPVDFNEGSLARQLAAAGFERTRPAYFSWMGVSYYLPLESILDTMGFIAGQKAASTVMFDIALDETAIRPDDLNHYRYFREEMSRTAEPWQTWLDPGTFRTTLLELGFTRVEDVEANAAVRRFVDSYEYPSLMSFITARKD